MESGFPLNVQFTITAKYQINPCSGFDRNGLKILIFVDGKLGTNAPVIVPKLLI